MAATKPHVVKDFLSYFLRIAMVYAFFVLGFSFVVLVGVLVPPHMGAFYFLTLLGIIWVLFGSVVFHKVSPHFETVPLRAHLSYAFPFALFILTLGGTLWVAVNHSLFLGLLSTMIPLILGRVAFRTYRCAVKPYRVKPAPTRYDI